MLCLQKLMVNFRILPFFWFCSMRHLKIGLDERSANTVWTRGVQIQYSYIKGVHTFAFMEKWIVSLFSLSLSAENMKTHHSNNTIFYASAQSRKPKFANLALILLNGFVTSGMLLVMLCWWFFWLLTSVDYM